MNIKKNLNIKGLITLILISILLIGGQNSRLYLFNRVPVNSYLVTSINSLSESKTSPFKIQQLVDRNFSNNISWEDSQLVLTQSTTFNSSTDLQIDNCSIFFDAPSVNAHIGVTIGEMSRLNITNSVLQVTSGFGSLSFLGLDAHISNSTIIGLGEYWDAPGLYLGCRIISIKNTRFISGFNGLTFSGSYNVNINNCSFQEIIGFSGYGGNGILGVDSRGITITNCSFTGTTGSMRFYNCQTISILDIYCENGRMGVDIQPNWHYSEVNDICIENGTFQNISVAIQMVGQNINILNNRISNSSFAGIFIGGREISIISNKLLSCTRGIMTPESLPSGIPNQIMESSVSHLVIENNLFDQISLVGILFSNYEYHTIFDIAENNFKNLGTGISFVGNIGGQNPEIRSWVRKNVFDNITEYAIEGISLNYLAHFQYISFIQNIFLNSSRDEYTSFQSRYYYMDDIRWDDGCLGNYWQSLVRDKPQDEDSNLIGDKLYIISIDHGQFDKAPLLSLKFFTSNSTIVSNHPTDLVRAKSELKGENATFQWIIRADISSTVSVYLDGQILHSEQNISSIEVSLLSVSFGLHNFSLVIHNGNQIYRDLVWVRILEDEMNIVTDFLIPLGVGVFVIAILTVLTYSIRNRYSLSRKKE